MIFFASLEMKREALVVLKGIDSPPEDALEAVMMLHLLKGPRHSARRERVVARSMELLLDCGSRETEAFLRPRNA